VDGAFELSRWVTKNRGRSWTTSELTRSPELDVRPVVPRGWDGYGHVLWMAGQYSYYTSFQTRIMMMVPGNSDDAGP